MASRTALVIGAQGVLGSSVVRALRDEGWSVLRGGRRKEQEADFQLVDLDEPETIAELSDIDVVINAVEHPGLAPERAVLETGGIVLNVSSISRVITSRMAKESGSTARGCVVFHCGLIPGLTSLAARKLVERHPETDEIELGLVFSADATTGRGGVEFAHRELTATWHHPSIRLPLPPPFGARRALQIANADRGWLGSIADRRTVKSYVCFEERVLNSLLVGVNALRLIRLLPIKPFVSGVNSASDELTREPVREWVAVRSGGRRIAASVVAAEGDYNSTGLATAAFADAALRRRSAGTLKPGVWASEDVFSLADLEDDLNRYGISVESVQ